MSAQRTGHCDHLNPVFADAQLKGEYHDWFRVRVSENWRSPHIGDVDSDEDYGGHISLSDGNGDAVQGVPPRQVRRSLVVYSYPLVSKRAVLTSQIKFVLPPILS